MKTNKIQAIVMAIFTAAIMGMYFIPAAYSNNSNRIYTDSTITDSTKAAVYTCPMHPEVISDKPGQCPKCGMDLILKENEKKDEGMNCPQMEKCKEMGCDMDKCKGHAGGCMSDCPMMKDHKSHDSQKHDHKSGDENDDSKEHKHKSGCQKKGC